MSSSRTDVLLVGAGKMGCALLEGWLNQGLVKGEALAVLEPSPSAALKTLKAAHGFSLITDADQAAALMVSTVVLAVKPQVMDDVLPGLVGFVSDETVFLSIAAGKSIAAMQSVLGSAARIARAMPNTPAAIGAGVSGLYLPAIFTAEQKSKCESLLKAVGDVVVVQDEGLIDAVTAVSGSGPAYVFLMIETLTAAGVDVGLSEEAALQLATVTLCGAGELASISDQSPALLRENVTSPGGTTAAALDILMADEGLRALMKKAVKAAFERAKELSV